MNSAQKVILASALNPWNGPYSPYRSWQGLLRVQSFPRPLDGNQRPGCKLLHLIDSRNWQGVDFKNPSRVCSSNY
jgi:hypothetical protein